MGAMLPSKMPGGKRKARRDDTDFTQYAEGGTVDPEAGFVGNAGVAQLDDGQLSQRLQEARRSNTSQPRIQALQKELEFRQGKRQKMKAGIYAKGGVTKKAKALSGFKGFKGYK
jgi:hypothetical protein